MSVLMSTFLKESIRHEDVLRGDDNTPVRWHPGRKKAI